MEFITINNRAYGADFFMLTILAPRPTDIVARLPNMSRQGRSNYNLWGAKNKSMQKAYHQKKHIFYYVELTLSNNLTK